jgi:6-phosphogluconolactonase
LTWVSAVATLWLRDIVAGTTTTTAMRIPAARLAFLGVSAALVACHGGGGGGATPMYTVGGTVVGLAGSGLVLQNNAGNNLAVASAGPFAFTASLASGATYNITVVTQPTSPSQTCAVTNGSGSVAGANVTTPQVSCTTNSFAVGGTVTGLDALGLVLQNNAGDDLAIAAGGAFAFSSSVQSGVAYAVTIKAQPNVGPLQVCTVTNGTGNVGNGTVTSVSVACATRAFKYLYVPNAASGSVSGYSIDAGTGELTAVPGSSFPTGASPGAPSGEPTGKFLYVPNRGSSTESPTISGYAVDAGTGSLTEIAGSPFALSTPPPGPNQVSIGSPVFHPSGAFGYVGLGTPYPPGTLIGQMYGSAVNAVTGELTQIAGTPYDVGWSSPLVSQFDATGNVLFVATNAMAGGIGAQIRTFLTNAPSGILSPVETYSTGGDGAIQPLLTPGERFLLVTSLGSTSLTVFAVDKSGGVPTGLLTAVTVPPVSTGPAGARPTQIAYNPRNDVFYVLNMNAVVGGSSSIASFRLDQATGNPTAVVAPVASNGANGAVFLHPSGRYLLQYNTSTSSFQRFALDAATGAPTLSRDVTVVGAIGGYIMDPSGKYLYASNSGSGTVSSYAIDQTTGAVTLVNAVPAGSAPGYPAAFMLQ